MQKFLRALAAALLLAPATVAAQAADSSAPPPVPREFRAAWVATVANIDWPSRPGLTTRQQQDELLSILDRAAAMKLNAIVFQVRPAADALYASKLEPWSYFLTGAQGRAPEPFWDPLAFAIEQAHARGLELHAWLNPYRARHPADTSPRAASHVSRRRPNLVRRYGPFDWMDPGEAAVQEQSLAVIRDIVKRYDVDGIHIDDYFYPYKVRDPVRGGELQFPDDASYRRYRRGGGRLKRDDWRRRNVNTFVRRMYETVKKEKPSVRVGISPFGIWRPGNPEGVAGLDAYESLYADARLWLRSGWVDYWTPQLYWRADSPQQNYASLLAWWSDQNLKDRHLWPGLFTSRVAGTEPRNIWAAGEVLKQIGLTRAHPRASGHVHFSMRALMENRDGLSDSLVLGLYEEPALVPASTWLDRRAPVAPTARLERDSVGAWALRATPGAKERPWLWVVRARHEDGWRTEVLPGHGESLPLVTPIAQPLPARIVVSVVDRLGNESQPTPVEMPESGTQVSGAQ